MAKFEVFYTYTKTIEEALNAEWVKKMFDKAA